MTVKKIFPTISRRCFLNGSISLSLASFVSVNNLYALKKQKKNLVIIMLQGGMDGLTAVPYNSSVMEQVRPDIIELNNKKLNADFSIHPELSSFHKLWQQNKASVVHATSIPYTGRSHFDGQDLMQTGAHVPYSQKHGWLGKAIEMSYLLNKDNHSIALSLDMPLLLRGKTMLDNYYPTDLSLPDTTMISMIAESFHNKKNANIYKTLKNISNRHMEDMHKENNMMHNHMPKDKGSLRNSQALAKAASEKLKDNDGPNIAVFNIEGFDTHAVQKDDLYGYAALLKELDTIIGTLHDNMGEAFDNTLVMTLTEFGRTLKQNYGLGTEHGYGSAILMAGGLLKTSQIYSDWPGIEKKNLFEERDLLATIDSRSIYCSALSACLDVDFEQLRRDVFFEDNLQELTQNLFTTS